MRERLYQKWDDLYWTVDWPFVASIVIIFGLVLLMIFLATKADHDCKAAGGHWVKTGQHWVMDVYGNDIMGHWEDDHECRKD